MNVAREPKPILTWVNHAAFIVSYRDVRLLADPWLTGTAFNRGWRLLTPSRFTSDDFRDITHIWFSHQHPDHFSPADLRAVPLEYREQITVVFQETIDKKVVRFCKALRFKAQIEMRANRWYELAPNFEVLCNGWSDRDSWMAIRTPNGTILNLNDCVVNLKSEARSIARLVGPVDALLTQFSFANWSGNPPDVAERRRKAQVKLEQIRTQVTEMNPRFVIPFASFVWFSHQDNFYHNAEMNRVGDVASFIEGELNRVPIVLYPGDTWGLGEDHDRRDAVTNYNRDFDEMLQNGPCDRSDPVPLEKIQRAANEYINRIKKRNPLVRLLPGLRTSVRIADLGQSFGLSLAGMQPLPSSAVVDVHLSSDSLFFAVRTPWGANALEVNGRFSVPKFGDKERFFRFFRAGDMNDHGFVMDYRWALRLLVRRIVPGAKRSNARR